MKIILTWDNRYDIGVVQDDNGNPAVFKTVDDAWKWMESNSHKLCSTFRVVDLDE